MRTRLVVAFLLAGSVVLFGAACGGSSASEPGSRLVPPGDFASAVAEPERVTINVLGPGVESIPGTDLAIPVDELAARSAELPSTSTPLAVYCAHGNASAAAVPVLEQLGYRDVVELEGGMAAWLQSGRSLLPPSG